VDDKAMMPARACWCWMTISVPLIG